MMSTLRTFAYFHGDGVRVLSLPYQGEDLTMIVILPDAREGLNAMEKALTTKQLRSWQEKLASKRVNVLFPRFTAESSLDLGESLQALGIRTAFNPDRADFSGMTGGRDLCISKVVHKARVEVNEEGTEAAAATAVTMMPTSARPRPMEEPEQFIADHPFFYAIRHNPTGSYLFMGRFVKP